MEYNNKGFATNYINENIRDQTVKTNKKAPLAHIKPIAASIKEDEFLAISDTHIGSYLEKIYYLDAVYEYAEKYNIRDIVHCGDLLHSNKQFVDPELFGAQKQLEHLIEVYPSDDKITNHILLGNHDNHLLKNNEQYFRLLRSRKDFNILGFKKAYIKWGQFLFSVNHPINNYRLNLEKKNVDFSLHGHHHDLKVVGSRVYLPTLSMNVMYYGEGTPFPGFIHVFKEDDTIMIFNLIFPEKFLRKMSIENAAYCRSIRFAPKNEEMILKLSPRRKEECEENEWCPNC